MEKKSIEGNVNLRKVIIFWTVFGLGLFLILCLYTLFQDDYRVRMYDVLRWEIRSVESFSEAWHTATYCSSTVHTMVKYVLPIYCGSVLLVATIFIWAVSKMQIVVTDKRVYGKTYFGRSVDLPMDSISAVGSTWFKGIAVSTSSGQISFLLIQNAKEIHATIRKLLIERQEQKEKAQAVPNSAAASPAEELKKYKELLDSGVITQEDFDAKKKQLLGL